MKQIPTQHQTNKPNDDSGEETGAKVRGVLSMATKNREDDTYS